MSLMLRVNGEERTVSSAPDTPLLWVLRDELKIKGLKFGCGVAQCGACTVYLDGEPIRSCVMPAEAVVGSEITTIEGLSGPVAEAVQAAWVAIDVPQCGYCQSGQIMSAVNLLSTNTSPTDEDIDAAMAGNACRCATYVRIRQAIKNAGKTLEA